MAGDHGTDAAADRDHSRPIDSAGNRRRGAVLFVSVVLLSWLGMQAVHEFGHVLHAWLSGGTVRRVVLDPRTISRTDVLPNPHPQFVVWGGPLWGCALPALAWWAARRRRVRWEYLPRFFCGFCLIANGAYLGSGLVFPVGDAEDLLRLGVPAWGLAVFALATVPAGLATWHNLARWFGRGNVPERVAWSDVVTVTLAWTLLAGVEIVLSGS